VRCEELMKRNVVFLAPKTSTREAAQRMRDENIGFIPICDTNQKAVGTLTDRDITIRLVADDKPTSTPVEDIMTREVVASRPEDDVREALRLMRENHKSRILCTDAQGRLLGVISLSDIAQQMEQEAARALREVSEREAIPVH
jgi:CBS domain-containing protein